VLVKFQDDGKDKYQVVRQNKRYGYEPDKSGKLIISVYDLDGRRKEKKDYLVRDRREFFEFVLLFSNSIAFYTALWIATYVVFQFSQV